MTDFSHMFSRVDVDDFILLVEEKLAKQKDSDLNHYWGNRLERLIQFREKVWGECKR